MTSDVLYMTAHSLFARKRLLTPLFVFTWLLPRQRLLHALQASTADVQREREGEREGKPWPGPHSVTNPLFP